jgi:copper chaperone CopZ
MKRELWISLSLAAAVIVLAASAPWLARELRSLPSTARLAARQNQRIVTLEVGGMTCSGCAAKIQTTLAEVAGVADVRVRLEERRAYVVCERAVPESALTAAVGRAGPGYLAAVARN